MKNAKNLTDLIQDAPTWLAGRYINQCGNHPIEKAKAIRLIADMINKIDNVTVRDEYTKLIRETYAIRFKDLKEAFNEIEKEQRRKRTNVISSSNGRSEDYQLPNEVLVTGGSFDKYENEILKYGVFIHTNIIYIIADKQPENSAKVFNSVSNFSCEIINHMEDEKNPMRLVHIKNAERSRIFDTPYESFLTKTSFMKMVEQFGNFQFDGSDRQYLKLKSKLMDEMGDGVKIEILGWQDDGFWAFNNCVVKDGEVLELDRNGMIEMDGTHYYIPSGNSIYKNNPFKYINQKRVRLINSKRTFEWLLKQGVLVHKQRFYHAVLFAVAGTFRDVIQGQLSFFPILFMYGAASTGKDNLVELIQSFYGHPQEALVMTGKDNTAKAKIRELAQFKNMPAHFSEYKADPDTDDLIKKLWDGRGYKRGTIDSHFSNEEVPVQCPVIITSNFYPTDDAVITRLIAMEFFDTKFTQQEVNEYDLLKEVIKEGISGFLVEILKLRSEFKKNFRKVFRETVAELKNVPDTITMAPRMIQNVAVLGAAYKLGQDAVPFPFTYDDWKRFAVNCLKDQERKRNTGSVVQRFWDVFLELVRDKHDPIEHEREYKIEGNLLNIRYSQIYARYQKMHYNLFREQPLSRSVLMDSLRKSDPFVDEKGSIRFGPDSKSSGLVFDLDKIHIKEDLLEIRNYLFNKRSQYGNDGFDGKAAASGTDDVEFEFIDDKAPY